MLQQLRRMEFTPQTVTVQTMGAAAVLYLIVVICCLWSIFDDSDGQGKRSIRWFWAVIVVAVPFVGILAYLPYSVRGNIGMLMGFWRKPR